MADQADRPSVLSANVRALIDFKARQLSRKPGFTRSDEEDIAQDLHVYFLSRQHQFDPDRGSAGTFVDRVIQSGIAMMLRDRKRKKRAAGFAAQSLEQSEEASGEHSTPFRDLLTEADLHRRTGASPDDPDRAERIAEVADAIASLTPEDQILCAHRVMGTATSAARELGVSRREVGARIERLRERFKMSGIDGA